MLDNYYTLRALVEEWKSSLISAEIIEIFSQEKDAVDIILEAAPGPNLEAREDYQESPSKSADAKSALHSLKISFRNQNRFMILSSGSRKAHRNTADLFGELKGIRINDIRLAKGDRIIHLDLSNELVLSIYLFGSKANMYLCQRDLVVEAYKKDDEWRQKERPKERISTTSKTDGAEVSIASKEADPSPKVLFPSFPKALIDELKLRSKESQKDLPTIGKEMLDGLEMRNGAWVYWKEDLPERLSLIRLDGLSELREEHFESVNKACRIVSGKRLRAKGYKEQFLPLKKKLSLALEKKEKLLENLTRAMLEVSRAERYQVWGDLLMSQPYDTAAVSKDVIVLSDLSDQNIEHQIALNPQQSLIENAKRYYEKAKSARTKKAHSASRLPDIEKSLATLRQLLVDFVAQDNHKELRKFIERSREEIERSLGQSISGFGFGKKLKAGETESRFRRFEISGGYVVLVGKNAKQNDELTLKASSKEDIWMHARGYPGSHTVLRTKGKGIDPPKNVLEEAAAIAAHFSKGRSSSLVPVSYTRRKYVSKPRGSVAGSVRLSQEKVVLVEPGIPDAGGGG